MWASDKRAWLGKKVQNYIVLLSNAASIYRYLSHLFLLYLQLRKYFISLAIACDTHIHTRSEY